MESNAAVRLRQGIATAVVLVLIGTAAGAAEQELRKGSHGREDVGEVVVFADGPNRLIVAVDTVRDGAADGLVDLWFVLQTREPATLSLPVHVAMANVQYREGALRVSAADGAGTVYDFSVAGYDATWSEPRGQTPVHTEGYGLARHTRETTMPIGAKKNATTAQEDECQICEPRNEDANSGGTNGEGASPTPSWP